MEEIQANKYLLIYIPFCVSLSKGEKAKCGMGSKGVSREGGLIIDNFRESDSDSRDVQVQLFF